VGSQCAFCAFPYCNRRRRCTRNLGKTDTMGIFSLGGPSCARRSLATKASAVPIIDEVSRSRRELHRYLFDLGGISRGRARWLTKYTKIVVAPGMKRTIYRRETRTRTRAAR